MAIGFLFYIYLRITSISGMEEKIERDLDRMFAPIISGVRFRIQEMKVSAEEIEAAA